MMKLILFRHGIAEDRRPDLSDADRALTAQGVDRTTRAAGGLAKLAGGQVDVVLTSPKVRARQTAELVGAALGLAPIELPVLADGPTEAIADALAGRPEGVVVAVGHEPHLSEVVERLCFGEARGRVAMKKAGASCIQTSGRPRPGACELARLAPGRMLRKVG